MTKMAGRHMVDFAFSAYTAPLHILNIIFFIRPMLLMMRKMASPTCTRLVLVFCGQRGICLICRK
jgi:hypothetical protein